MASYLPFIVSGAVRIIWKKLKTNRTAAGRTPLRPGSCQVNRDQRDRPHIVRVASASSTYEN